MEVIRDVYRGLNEESLKNMDLDTFKQYVKARARRAIERALKGLNMEYMALIEKVRKLKKKKSKKLTEGIKTHCREAVIIPEWLGLVFLVYNGKEWKQVKIDVNKLGHRLGEYSYTTTFNHHSGPGVGATRGSKFVSLK